VGIDLAEASEDAVQAKNGDPTECADLVVTDFRIMPTFPIEDQNADIEIDVKNQGTCDSLSFLVQWKSSQFAPTGPTDFIPSLAAGATTTANFQYAFPRAGNFTTVATVDSDNTVEEFNEVNNIEIYPVTVLKAGIDLVIWDFRVEPAPGVDASIPPLPVQNRLSRASITVQNLGNRAAGDFLVRWTPGVLAPALTSQVNGLLPGACETVTFDYTYATARTTTTTARVDSSFVVSEVDETNNVESMEITVEPQRPDLEITALEMNPAQPVRGLGATMSMLVRNRGNTAAPSFIVEWRPRPLAQPLSRQINGLDVGASTVVEFDYTYTIAGSFTSTATLDRTNGVQELDEDNNTEDLEILVVEDFIDLQIIEMDIRSGPPGFACQDIVLETLEEPILTQGQNVNVCVKIINNGNAPSNSFVVEWNPDALGLITPSLGTLVTQIDTIDPGEVLELPIDYIYEQHGNFRVVAKVDAFNNVEESNESNQLFVENVVVQPAPIDLVITSFVIEPDSPIRASKATAFITVKNNGPYPTDAFFVRWKPTGVEAGGGPIAQVLGLNAAGQPDDSVTVEIESTFFVAGPYTSYAEADTFDQIIESNENNNSATRSVEVQPRETTLSVNFDDIHVFEAFEDGLDGDGEWKVLFAVLDPGANCNTTIDLPWPAPNIDLDIDGIQCLQFSDGSVEDGDTLNTNKIINVTLVESFPLVLGAIALEVDPTSAPEQPGIVLQFWSAVDYRGVNDRVVEGIEGECGGGHCYDLDYVVSIIAEPPVPYGPSGSGPEGEANGAIEPELPIMLPDGLAQLLPQTVVLPEELTRDPDQYWDWDRYLPVFTDGFETGDLTGGWVEGGQ
jgi:subtilase family serine protease